MIGHTNYLKFDVAKWQNMVLLYISNFCRFFSSFEVLSNEDYVISETTQTFVSDANIFHFEARFSRNYVPSIKTVSCNKKVKLVLFLQFAL